MLTEKQYLIRFTCGVGRQCDFPSAVPRIGGKCVDLHGHVQYVMWSSRGNPSSGVGRVRVWSDSCKRTAY